jgi:hypothetical protein
MRKKDLFYFILAFFTISCVTDKGSKYKTYIPNVKQKVEEYIPITLIADLSHLSEGEKRMIALFFEVGEIMDDLFWKQSWGDKSELLSNIDDEYAKKYIEINYGPWERLNNNNPFIEGIGSKPLGACFYPSDMTKEEFEQLQDNSKKDLYSIVKRNPDTGDLYCIPYHEEYKEELQRASELLKEAAGYAEDEGFKRYLKKRAGALLSSKYYESDIAWMSMKDNAIDFVVGPIETYEDNLFGAKAAFEAYILIKDKAWSDKLKHLAKLLPSLQQALPVEEKYKSEMPGDDSDLGAYDVVFYGGDCNAGSKTIAINLPNDPKVHLEKGSRKLQLKNTMQAKFEKILMPISQMLIEEEQLRYITFDAFFENVMLHEVAHGLGIKETVNAKNEVREALKEAASTMEEGKADVLGLFMVDKLAQLGELGLEKDIRENYVTFMAGLFRSIRFGASSSHGKANMIRFNYFKERKAFVKDPVSGKYKVDFEQMYRAVTDLSKEILTIQGEGDYEKAKQMIKEMGNITPSLQMDLDKINKAGISRDIRFIQGKDILGL